MEMYKVYEIDSSHRQHGKLIKVYKTKSAAIKCMSKSIYRYIIVDNRTITFKL